jgi:hypothetical protein
VTVLAEALDVILGSPLTSLSLIGPNPGLGVRFYGIGNELEAVLAPLTIIGTGAAITAFAPRLGRRAGAITFLASGLLFALVFAAGRFGADVGAAIVFPAGAAVAAAVFAGSRRTALLALAAPLLALAALALIDLLSGGNAHLTRSVLDAGGLHDLADVAERRLRLSAHSFARRGNLFFAAVVLVLAVLGWRNRERLLAWFDRRPAARAAFAGALAATVVGTLANDSGALLLEVGAAYLVAFLAFAWAQAPQARREGRDPAPTGALARPIPFYHVRIALVSPYSWTYQGGVNRHVEALAEELLGRGHHVRVLAPFDPPDRLSKALHRADAEPRDPPDYLIG